MRIGGLVNFFLSLYGARGFTIAQLCPFNLAFPAYDIRHARFSKMNSTKIRSCFSPPASGFTVLPNPVVFCDEYKL
jgi:hypothetical protein